MKRAELTVDVRMINSSGIGSYLKNILPIIVDNFSTTLLGNRNELQSFEWAKNCEIIQFNSKIYSLGEQLKYRRIIPKTDLLWCPHFNIPLLPVKTNKIATTIHDVNHLALSKDTSFVKNRYAKMLYDNAVIKSQKIITVSNFSKSELLKYTEVDASKMAVIHCGVNSSFFKKATINPIELPKRYILFVGNVKPHKNLITLLKAYNELQNDLKQKYDLVVMGKREGFISSDRKALEYIETNNLSDKIFFTGYVDDNLVPLVYKNATLFVFPSYYEGFGLPLLEAMVSGVPVISSNAASLQEVGGDSVVYFNPDNTNELKEKMKFFLEGDSIRNQYIEKGFNRIQLFSWEKAAKLHVEIFKKLLSTTTK